MAFKIFPSWVNSHFKRVLRYFEMHVFPWVGARPIEAISARELLVVFRRIEEKGILETAHRIQQNCGRVFRYAMATGRAERDPTADLRGALPPVNSKHMASTTDPKETGGLLRAIDDYRGSIVTRCARRLAPLVFVRPGELRHAEWIEIDFEARDWRIPAAKMKGKDKHIVPLSNQSVDVLQEIQPLTGKGKYVFPSPRIVILKNIGEAMWAMMGGRLLTLYQCTDIHIRYH